MFRIWVTSSFLPGDTKTSFETRDANWLLARQRCPVGKAAQGGRYFGGVIREKLAAFHLLGGVVPPSWGHCREPIATSSPACPQRRSSLTQCTL